MKCPNCKKKLKNTTSTETGHYKCMNPECPVVRITLDWHHVKEMKKAYLKSTSGKTSKKSGS